MTAHPADRPDGPDEQGGEEPCRWVCDLNCGCWHRHPVPPVERVDATGLREAARFLRSDPARGIIAVSLHRAGIRGSGKDELPWLVAEGVQAALVGNLENAVKVRAAHPAERADTTGLRDKIVDLVWEARDNDDPNSVVDRLYALASKENPEVMDSNNSLLPEQKLMLETVLREQERRRAPRRP